MAINGNLPPNTNVNSTTEYFNNYFTDVVTTSSNVNDAVIGYFQSVTGDVDTGKTLAATIIYTALNQGLDPMSLIDEFKKLRSGRRVEVKTPIDATTVIDTYTSYDQLVEHKNEYPIGQLFYISSIDAFYRTYFAEIPVDQPMIVQTVFSNPTFNQDNIDLQTQPILMGQPQLETIYVTESPVYIANDIPFPMANDAPFGSNVALITTSNASIDTTYTTPVEYDIPVELVNPDDYIVKTYLDQSIQVEVVSGYLAETVSLGGAQTVRNYFYISYTQEKDELTPYLTVLLNTNRVNTSLLGIGNTPPVNKYIQRSILA